MTNDEKKEAAKVMAAHHGLGEAHLAVTAARTAAITQFLDVSPDGRVFVCGGEVTATGARYSVTGKTGPERYMFDVVLSGNGGNVPYSIAKLIADLKLADLLDIPRR